MNLGKVKQENEREKEEAHWESVFSSNLEKEDSETPYFMMEQNDLMLKLRGKYCDPLDDLRTFHKGESDEQVLIAEWYYRLMPALERQHFIISNQFKSFANIADDALAESEDMFTVS